MDVEPTPVAVAAAVAAPLGPPPAGKWRGTCRACGRTRAQHEGGAFGATNCRRPCVKCGRALTDHADTATGWYCRHDGGGAAAAAAPAVNGDGDEDEIMGDDGAEA